FPLRIRLPPRPTLFPYTTLFRSHNPRAMAVLTLAAEKSGWGTPLPAGRGRGVALQFTLGSYVAQVADVEVTKDGQVRVLRLVSRSEEHTSELQSLTNLLCRLLL